MPSELKILEARLEQLQTEFHSFLKMTGMYGFEGSVRKFYGIYRAQVMDNVDPEQRGRIRIMCPSVGDTESNFPDVWVDPAFNGAGTNHGEFWPPEIGDSVRVAYDNGDSGQPCIYWGGWYGNTDLPTEFQYASERPQRRGFVTKAGHVLTFNDEPGKESIQIIWHKPDPGDASLTDPTVAADRTQGKSAFFTFTPSGSVLLGNAEGATVSLDVDTETLAVFDKNGNSLSMDGDGIKVIDKDGNLITLDGGSCLVSCKGPITLTGEVANIKTGGVFLGDPAVLSAVLGEPLMAWLSTHIHGTGVGPSTPPIVPPPPVILSRSVKLKP